MYIVKRNGKREKFDPNKIKSALEKANQAVSEEHRISNIVINNIAEKIETLANEKETMFTVEDIHNAIENYLININKYELAKSCIKYKYVKAMANNKYTELMDAVANKIACKEVVNQNANLDEKSFGGRIGETTSLIMKQYALDYCVSPTAKANHLNNEIYLHDLDQLAVGSHNCAHEDSWITIKNSNDNIRYVQLKDIAKELGMQPNQIAYLQKSDYSILARDGWTKLNSITSRNTKKDELLYTIKTHKGIPLKLTGDHRVPIIRDNKEILSYVKDLKEGDLLLEVDSTYVTPEDLRDRCIDWSEISTKYGVEIRVVSLKKFRYYIRYKYGINLTSYVRDNNFKIKSNREDAIEWFDFKSMIEKYPITYDVLNSLKIKAKFGDKRFPIYIPFTPELAKLYAFIYADGGVYLNKKYGTYQLCFTNTNYKLIEEFQRCYESVFGFKLCEAKMKNEWNTMGYWLFDGSQITYCIFKDYAGARKYHVTDLSIPDWVMNGAEDIKIAYLGACIDTDGCLSNGFNYTSCCKRYCEQLNILMQSLGYRPHTVKSGNAGDKTRFGVKATQAQYDSYATTLSRAEDLKDLCSKVEIVKNKDSYIASNTISRIFNESKILKITSEPYNGIVYDLETESHWYAINNYISHNCMSIPFDQLLSEGFDTRQTDVRASGSINTALQLVAVIMQLQSLNQFGGVSSTHLDGTLVPYVRKSFSKYFKDEMADRKPKWDNTKVPKELKFEDPEYTKRKYRKIYKAAMHLLEKETHQAVEALYHNLNTLQSRSGNQLPFSSVNFGLCTEPEGRLISKEMLTVCREGLGKFHRTSIFPCVIFQCKKGVNMKEGDPNYDLFRLALQCTSERLYPNYANADWSNQQDWVKYDRKVKLDVINSLSAEDMKSLMDRIKENPDLGNKLYLDENLNVIEDERLTEVFSTMGCRTANGADVNFKENYKENIKSVIKTGKLKNRTLLSAAQKDGRGNICPTTIILPTLAMEADRDVNKFFKLLNKKLDEAKDSLIDRYEWICSQPWESAKFMYSNHVMAGYIPEEGIKSALKHGTLAVGLLGMAETLELLVGCNQTKPEGITLAKKICQLYKDKCNQFKKEYNLNFGVYYTPAENLCYTAMKKFQKEYGVIEKVSDHNYFTNSIHVPVWERIDAIKKIDIESELTGYSSAGCITYIELDASVKHNIGALEKLVTYAMEKDIPYFALNVPNDVCMNCGHQEEMPDRCPICGSNNIQRLRRVTGYLTGNYSTAFNAGKIAEVEDRVKHTGVMVEKGS